MCLMVFGYRAHPRYDLVFAGNRDEFRARPTVPADFWPGPDRDILAGRDLQGAGTWLGVTRSGRFAAVTNFRDPQVFRPDARSRGLLVADFLRGAETPDRFLERLDPVSSDFNGFSLILGDRSSLWYFSSHERPGRQLESGIYGLSNGILDEPWPKVVRARNRLRGMLKSATIAPAELLALLADRAQAPERQLPETGVGLATERMLSSIFVDTPDYGTVSSTVLLIDHTIHFVERTVRPRAEPEDREYILPLAAAA